MLILKSLPAFLFLFLLNVSLAQTSQLGTFNIGRFNSFYPRIKFKIDNKIFFVGSANTKNGTERYDLWVSDGTPNGTKALNIKRLYHDDIQYQDSLIFYRTSNNFESDITNLWQLNARTLETTKIFTSFSVSDPIITNERLFFTARDSSDIFQLYGFDLKSKQLNKIAPSTSIRQKRYAFNGKVLLYWAVTLKNNTFGINELWRTDGTAQGTFRIDTSKKALLNLYSFKDKFYYNQWGTTTRGESIYEAWETDGQSKATKLPLNYIFPEGVWTEKGFVGSVRDSVYGTDIWFSDFSANGAQNIGDMDSSRYSLFTGNTNTIIRLKIGSYPNSFSQLNNKIYFFASNDSCRLAFYETDGTKLGTKLVKPLAFKKDGPSEENARNVYQANGKIYAEVLTPQYGNEIMVSDGTPEGTKIMDIWKGGGNSYTLENLRLVDFTDKNAYFVANNGISGNQIWQIDSNNTANRISNISGNIGSLNTHTLGSIKNKVLFMTQRDSLLSISVYDEKQPTVLQENLKRDNYKWLTSFGGIGYNSGTIQRIAQSLDNQQNTFILGRYGYKFFSFYDTTKLLVRNTRNKEAFSGSNLFLAKYDSIGKLAWSKDLFVSTSSFGENKSMSIDDEGNIYVLAQNHVSNSFENLLFVDSTLLHNSLGNFGFILKFDTNGRFLWSKKIFMSFSNGELLDIVAKGKNIYVLGKNESITNIDNTPIPAGLFAIKMNVTGKVEWVSKLNANNKLEITDSSIDNLGNLIVADDQGTIAKLRSDKGDVLWTKKLPLSKNLKITSQNDGSIFILTQFSGTASFDKKTVTASKKEALAMVGLSPNGEVLAANVLEQDGVVLPMHISTNENGLFRVIYYKEIAEEPTLVFPNWNINNRRSIIVKQLTPTGLEMAQREVFIRSYDVNSLKGDFDKNNDVVISGENIVYVDTLSNVPLGYRDFVVISRFSFIGKNAEPKDNSLAIEDISLSPNPTANFLSIASKDGDFSDANILIYNILGKLETSITTNFDIGIKLVDVSNLNNGTYILVIKSGDKLLTKKFVKL